MRDLGAYNVQMKRYSASEARKRIAEVLDGAEHGEKIVIERKGLRFLVLLDGAKPGTKRSKGTRSPVLEILDPDIEKGQWTWRSGRRGLHLARRTPSR